MNGAQRKVAYQVSLALTDKNIMGNETMTYATFRENGETLHHITSQNGIQGILATAGLLAEAINYRNGHTGGLVGRKFSLSVVSPGIDGVFSLDEYQIRAVGSFWLIR